MKRLALAFALMVGQPLLADSNLPPAYWADRQLPDARQESQAQALMQELRCLVCQGQSIADSDAELAGDMRDLVRRRIAAGDKPATIRAWLIERYGTWISYKPTAEVAAWPLWLAPLALLLIGAWLIAKRIGADGLAGPVRSGCAEPWRSVAARREAGHADGCRGGPDARRFGLRVTGTAPAFAAHRRAGMRSANLPLTKPGMPSSAISARRNRGC